MVSTMDKQQTFSETRRQGDSIAAIARRFNVSIGTVRYWLAKAARVSSGVPIRSPGRPPFLENHERENLKQLVQQRPETRLVDILEEFKHQTGKHLQEGTARQLLHRLGVRRVRPVQERPQPAPDATRYKPRHRCEPPGDSYPSDLTDAEWKILGPIFSEEGGPGYPPDYDRRRILDAVFYVVRGGVAWRMLPKNFPKWQNVYAHFRRWSAASKFETMHDLLRSRWREREGKKPTATASIIDSQTVKTTEKGGAVDTTPESEPKDESGTSW